MPHNGLILYPSTYEQEHAMFDYYDETDDHWQMPPAQTEELPAGLIEDQI